MVEDALQLVVLRNSPVADQLAQLPQPLALQQILQGPARPLVGVEANRSYGEQLDKLILQQQQALYLRTSSSQDLGSLLPMLQRRFIDVMLEYPKIAERSGLVLQYFRLQEAEPLNLVHFACSKGPQGEQVVATLNQVILQLSQQADYQALVKANIPAEVRESAFQYWQQQLVVPSP